MAKVFLGVGHGGSDPGAVGYLREEDLNLNMALACRDYLEANGVQVGMSRTKDENDTLNEEIKECNAFNPDLAVDIHNNAGGGDGFEVYHSYMKGKGTTLAQNIETEVKAIGQNSRGCKTRKNSSGTADYYGFIRETKAPAVIVEGLFVDNANDVKIADTLEEQKIFGVAIAKGILKTLGITPSEKPITPTLKYKVGDKVNVSSYYASSTDPNEKAKHKNATGTITKVLTNGAKNPYLLDNGNIGWCNDGDIRGYATTYSYYPACDKKHTSLVAALKSIKVDSSFNFRKKIAIKNNIKNYTGTAQQNIQLLTKLKAGRLIKA